jgi:hypothetical protein
MVAKIKTYVQSIAESVSVCSDSNYNQTVTHIKRRIKKATAPNARHIDDEHRSYTII